MAAISFELCSRIFFVLFLLTLPQKLTLCCVTLSSSFHVSSSMLMVSCLSSFFLLPFVYFAVLFGQLCDSHPLSSFSLLLSAIGGVPLAFYHIFSLIQCRGNSLLSKESLLSWFICCCFFFARNTHHTHPLA